MPARVLGRVVADPRRALADAAQARGTSLASLSRMIGRPYHYLGRFVRAGAPRALRPGEHDTLAAFFGVEPRQLGIRDLWAAND